MKCKYKTRNNVGSLVLFNKILREAKMHYVWRQLGHFEVEPFYNILYVQVKWINALTFHNTIWCIFLDVFRKPGKFYFTCWKKISNAELSAKDLTVHEMINHYYKHIRFKLSKVSWLAWFMLIQATKPVTKSVHHKKTPFW